MPASQQPAIADRVAIAMAEITAWMTTERDERRRQLCSRPDQGWQEVAETVTLPPEMPSV